MSSPILAKLKPIFCRFSPILGQENLGTGIGGGQISERGGVKILIFWGSRNLTLFYRVSTENPQFGGQESKLCNDNFRGEFPPL